MSNINGTLYSSALQYNKYHLYNIFIFSSVWSFKNYFGTMLTNMNLSNGICQSSLIKPHVKIMLTPGPVLAI